MIYLLMMKELKLNTPLQKMKQIWVSHGSSTISPPTKDGYGSGWLMADEGRLRSDPYAGVFFSKERSQEVIEAIEEPRFIELEVAGETRTLRVLSRSDWMSGCLEDGE
jgi:hypothetical protein